MISIAKSLLYVFLALIINNSHSQALKDYNYYKAHPYPTFQNVVSHFFNHYSIETLEEKYIIKFLKSPEGYFTYEYSPNTNPETKRNYYLLWSFEEGYLKLPYPEKMDNGIEDLIRNNLHDELHFNINMFHGYDNCENDVIKVLQNEKELEDIYLDYLARAYSHYATKQISKRYFQYEKTDFEKNFDYRDIPQEKISTTIEYHKKAIDTYKRLKDQNPAYHNFMGNIQVKYWNEAMVPYLDFKVLGLDSLSKTFIHSKLYDPFYISMAKNILNTCPEKAILFVGGDLDTYPLLYVQEILSFRSDVTLVNISLADMPRYVNYLVNFLPDDNKVKTSIPLAVYKSFDYLYTDEDTSPEVKNISFDLIKKDLTNGSGVVIDSIEYNPGSFYSYVRHNRIEVTINTENFLYELEFKNYITMSDLFVLDILSSNSSTRPICFSNTLSSSILSIYNPYLIKEGLVYRLTKGSRIKGQEENLGACYKHLLSYSLDGFDKSVALDTMKINIIYNYRMTYGAIANKLADSDKTKALQLLTKIEEKMSSDITAFHLGLDDMVDAYYKLKMTKKADEIVADFLIISEGIFSNRIPVLDESDKNFYGYICYQFSELCKRHKRIKLSNNAETLLKKYF